DWCDQVQHLCLSRSAAHLAICANLTQGDVPPTKPLVHPPIISPVSVPAEQATDQAADRRRPRPETEGFDPFEDEFLSSKARWCRRRRCSGIRFSPNSATRFCQSCHSAKLEN